MRLLLLLLCALSPALASAQFQSGSPYSAFGIGDLLWQGRGHNAALAGAGIGMRSDAYINLRNPAAYTAMRQPYNMALETGFSVKSISLATASEEAQQRDGGLTDITLWLRPHKNWAMTVGIQPYSQVGYAILSDRVLENIQTTYQLINEGEGGLSRLFWGHALQISPQLSIGANANFLFGTISQREQFLSPGDLGRFEVQSETILRGFGLDGGIQWTVPVGVDQLTFGALFQTATKLWSKTDRVLLNGTNEIETEGSGSRDDYRIPFRYGFGSSYQRSNWVVTAEASYENWARLRLDSDVTFIDTWSGTLAIEVAPFKDLYQDYFQAYTLRAGFSYRNSYLDFDGQNFGHWLTSFGLGIPIGPQRNQLHLTYSYQDRGTMAGGLIQEQTHQLSVAFTVRDIWFRQRKFN